MSHAPPVQSAALLTLSACNLAPAYRTPPVAVPLAYKEVPPWEPARPADDLSRGAWWERFSDDTLNGLEPLVDAANPDLAATVARYDEARAYAVEAAAGLYPQINGDTVLTANRQSVNRPLRSAGNSPAYYGANQIDAQASYEVDLWGKLRNEAAAGRATAQASAADLASMRLSLQAELASDYLALRGADAQDQLLTDTVAAYQKALDLTEHRFQGKIASSLDVSRAQTQLQVAQADLANATATRALMEHAVAILVGDQPGSFALPPAPAETRLPEIPTGLASTLLQRRPDIASAERAANAANSGVGVARAALYPSLSLNLLGGFQATSLSLLSLPNSFWTVGPDISLPLFDGGALDARGIGGLCQVPRSRFDLSARPCWRVSPRSRTIWPCCTGSARNPPMRMQLSPRRSTPSSVALNLYRQGADSYLEVVTAQTPLLQAQQAQIDLRTRRAARRYWSHPVPGRWLGGHDAAGRHSGVAARAQHTGLGLDRLSRTRVTLDPAAPDGKDVPGVRKCCDCSCRSISPGSTDYKAKFEASAGCRLAARLRSLLPDLFRSCISARSRSSSSDETELPSLRVWKVLGDEIIFTSEPQSGRDTALLLRALFSAMTRYEAQHFSDFPLHLKATAWSARFPSPNIEIEISRCRMASPMSIISVRLSISASASPGRRSLPAIVLSHDLLETLLGGQTRLSTISMAARRRWLGSITAGPIRSSGRARPASPSRSRMAPRSIRRSPPRWKQGRAIRTACARRLRSSAPARTQPWPSPGRPRRIWPGRRPLASGSRRSTGRAPPSAWRIARHRPGGRSVACR